MQQVWRPTDARRRWAYDLGVVDVAALYRQALPLYREVGDRLGEAEALVGYGRALLRTGSPSAPAVILDAVRLFEQLGRADRTAEARRLLSDEGSGPTTLANEV